MFLIQKIGRNTLVHFCSKIISLFLNVFVFALIARYLAQLVLESLLLLLRIFRVLQFSRI